MERITGAEDVVVDASNQNSPVQKQNVKENESDSKRKKRERQRLRRQQKRAKKQKKDQPSTPPEEECSQSSPTSCLTSSPTVSDSAAAELSAVSSPAPASPIATTPSGSAVSVDHHECLDRIRELEKAQLVYKQDIDMIESSNQYLWDRMNFDTQHQRFLLHGKMEKQNISGRTLKITRNSLFVDDISKPSALLSTAEIPLIRDLRFELFPEDAKYTSTKSSIFTHFYKSSAVVLKQYHVMNMAHHEYRMMKACHSDKGIPHAFGICHFSPENDDALVLNYVGDYSFADLVETQKETLGNGVRAARILLEIGLTMQHMHEENIVFNNIQPESIVYDTYTNPHFVGFSKATLVRNAVPFSDMFLSENKSYLAPEVMEGKPPSTASDVYSYGLLLNQVFGVLYRERRCSWTPVRLAAQCLDKNPSKRPSGTKLFDTLSVLKTLWSL